MSDKEPIPEETSDFRRRAAAASAVAQQKAQELVTDIKGRGPFFIAKLYVVGAWVLISLLTLILAPPSKADWVASQQDLPWGLSNRTEFIVQNVDGGDRDEAVIELTGNGVEFDGSKKPHTWRSKPMQIYEGQQPKRLHGDELLDEKGAVGPDWIQDVTELRIFEGKKQIARVPVPKKSKP